MSTSKIALNEIQNQLKNMAENIIFKEKIERQNILTTMNTLVHQLTADQLISVINSINSPVALKFMIPAGTFGEARNVLFARIAALQPKKG